jgi:hypothetical protein
MEGVKLPQNEFGRVSFCLLNFISRMPFLMTCHIRLIKSQWSNHISLPPMRFWSKLRQTNSNDHIQ